MKAKFYGPLIVSMLSEGQWRLESPLHYWSEVAERMIYVPSGFVTDFASVPRLPLAYLLAGGKANASAVVHDWLYSTHEVDRATADAILREAIGVEGYSWFTQQLMWAGVRLGGGFAWPKTENLAQPHLKPDQHERMFAGAD